MKNLARLSLFSAFSGLVLIVAGGLVKSHEAGLSVPDWPLSYGQWMPPMVGKIFWEHGHRMIASFVGFLTVVMAIGIHLDRTASNNIKSFSRILVELVILQGVFGGLTVILNLPPAVSIVHAALGQVFFSALWLFAYAVNREAFPKAFEVSDEQKPKFEKAFRVARATAIILLIQLFLGAATRHLRHMHIAWTHTGFAMVVIMHFIFIFIRVTALEPEDRNLRKTAIFLFAAVMLQAVLGACSLGYTQFLEKGLQPSMTQVWFTTFHQSLGAVLLATTVILAAMLRRRIPE